MTYCPCCSDLLLRHARSGRSYLYCPHCRQEMPEVPVQEAGLPQSSVKAFGIPAGRADSLASSRTLVKP